MTTPRSKLVDDSVPQFYHIVSRCVRQAFLCGRVGQKDFSHRKYWLLNRLELLTSAFALEVYAFAVMSNHFHLVVYYNPCAARDWSDSDVVERWLKISSHADSSDSSREEIRRDLLADAERIRKIRFQLGSLSYFMKYLKQPLALRANREDESSGHFFEKRFYSGALLSESAVLSAMAYVDMNPIRANLAKSLDGDDCVSIAKRMSKRSKDPELKPVFSGLQSRSLFRTSLQKYVARLHSLLGTSKKPKARLLFAKQSESFGRMHRAYGSSRQLRDWMEARGLRVREPPLPT